MSATPHVGAMITLLTGHTWTSPAVAPKSIHEGPIPDVLEFPAIGVFVEGGQATDETLDGVEFTDTVMVTIASPQDVGGEITNQSKLQAMKNEIIALIYQNPNLGSESVVRGTKVMGWDRSVVQFTSEMGDQATFEYVLVRYSVRYVMTLA